MWITRVGHGVQMAEISRVLRPEGVFVASTFLTATAPLGAVFGDDTVRPLAQVLDTFTVCLTWFA